MLDGLVSVVESFSTIGRALANFFNGLIEMIGLIGYSMTFLADVVVYVIPLPLRAFALAVFSVSVVYLIIGRQH